MKLVQGILKETQGWKAAKTMVIIEKMLLTSKNFKEVLFRNCQMPKNQLHETAKEVKE